METVLLIGLIAALSHELGSRRGSKPITAGMLGLAVLILAWHWQGTEFVTRVQNFHMPDFGSSWPGIH